MIGPSVTRQQFLRRVRSDVKHALTTLTPLLCILLATQIRPRPKIAQVKCIPTDGV